MRLLSLYYITKILLLQRENSLLDTIPTLNEHLSDYRRGRSGTKSDRD